MSNCSRNSTYARHRFRLRHTAVPAEHRGGGTTDSKTQVRKSSCSFQTDASSFRPQKLYLLFAVPTSTKHIPFSPSQVSRTGRATEYFSLQLWEHIDRPTPSSSHTEYRTFHLGSRKIKSKRSFILMTEALLESYRYAQPSIYQKGEEGDCTATILFRKPGITDQELRLTDDSLAIDKSFAGFTPLYTPANEKGPIAAEFVSLHPFIFCT